MNRPVYSIDLRIAHDDTGPDPDDGPAPPGQPSWRPGPIRRASPGRTVAAERAPGVVPAGVADRDAAGRVRRSHAAVRDLSGSLGLYADHHHDRVRRVRGGGARLA